MTSDTSDNNNSSYHKSTPAKKKTNFTTDYMPDLLAASDKLKPEEERRGFVRNASDNKSDTSEDLTNYISDKKSENYTRNGSDTTNVTTTHHPTNTNIFQKTIQHDQYKFDTKNPEDKKDLPEDYDNYNELSEEGKMLKRLDMLRKLGELAQYKVKLSQNYNMNSDYFTMKYEYQLHTNIRAKQNFVNWTSSLMLNCIYGIEILNEKYNPWELKLTGWSEQINADITNYYDVFGEIFEKYNKPGKSMSPEIKLVLMLGGSALKFHLNNVALSNRIGIPNPSFNGVTNGPMGSTPNSVGQDPKIIEQMRQQAMLDRMREDTKKQAEALQKKSELEHNMAVKQMEDMMLLQKTQNDFVERENVRKQKMEDFERIKSVLEQQNQPRAFDSMNQYSQVPSAPIQSQFQPQFQQFQHPQQIQQPLNPLANAYAQQRRIDINEQLAAMRNNQTNIKLKSQDMRELAAERLYPTSNNNGNMNKMSPNIKKRDGINIDTSSESDRKKSDSSSTESSASSSSSKSSSSSSTTSSSESNVKSKSTSSKKNQIEKSLSSRNNQSTYSKRKYKRSGITIDT